MSDCPKTQQQNKTNFADTHFAQILFQESVGTPTNSVDLMGKRENLELVDEYEQTRKRLRKLESKLRKQKKKEQSSHRERRGRSRTTRQPGACGLYRFFIIKKAISFDCPGSAASSRRVFVHVNK